MPNFTDDLTERDRNFLNKATRIQRRHSPGFYPGAIYCILLINANFVIMDFRVCFMMRVTIDKARQSFIMPLIRKQLVFHGRRMLEPME